MRWLTAAVLVLAVTVSGCRILGGAGDDAGARVVQAVRAETPPVIDGKLDDACWQQAELVTGFYKLMSDNEVVEYQSIGRVCYDDTHLYIGMKCLMPKGTKPKGVPRGHDSQKIFGDEVVEIMLDPGRTRNRYYQLVLSAYGGTFDAYRESGGAREDDSWDGEWVGKAHHGDGFWSAEMAVPYHNLGITAKTAPTWGINLCREGKKPDVCSSVGDEGIFNDATKFPVLRGGGCRFPEVLFQPWPRGRCARRDLRKAKGRPERADRERHGQDETCEDRSRFCGARGQGEDGLAGNGAGAGGVVQPRV